VNRYICLTKCSSEAETSGDPTKVMSQNSSNGQEWVDSVTRSAALYKSIIVVTQCHLQLSVNICIAREICKHPLWQSEAISSGGMHSIGRDHILWLTELSLLYKHIAPTNLYTQSKTHLFSLINCCQQTTSGFTAQITSGKMAVSHIYMSWIGLLEPYHNNTQLCASVTVTAFTPSMSVIY